MSDYSELIKQLRGYPEIEECEEAANALEAQAKEIAGYQKDADEYLIRLDELNALRTRIAELERENRRVKNIIYAYEAARAALKGEK
jgi:hypothetical protein